MAAKRRREEENGGAAAGAGAGAGAGLEGGVAHVSKAISGARGGDGAVRAYEEAETLPPPWSTAVPDDGLEYHSGFGNEFQSEAVPGTLPVGQNSPQRVPHGLYAEQLSGTAFTVPRADNKRSWLYRVRPSVMHSKFEEIEKHRMVSSFAVSGPGAVCKADPNQMRWSPLPHVDEAESAGGEGKDAELDFVEGLATMLGAGDAAMKAGLAVHVYRCNKSMGAKAFCNADGDMLLVPQEGTLTIRTEFGVMVVAPREIAVLSRGMRWSVDVEGNARGYICEVFTGHFALPNLGPIGANGLANPRDFLTPVAAYEKGEDVEYTIVQKFCGSMYAAKQAFSPFNVVAWHGNYVPYKYNMDRFMCMNSVTYDHPDPSIYTILTCPSDTPGIAVCDFVCFPPRWMVMEHSFRPPYFHRNTMSEFMGMVYGSYDAKTGFRPGGASMHSCMTPHGPDTDTFIGASNAKLEPAAFKGGLAFMFETTYMMSTTKWALEAPHRDVEYQECWTGMPKLFDPTKRDVEFKRDD